MTLASSSSGRSFVIAVNGAVKSSTASTDASLSGLALENPDDNSAITLSPTFATGTTSYTASVANSVDEITVLPTTNDGDATIE